MTSWQGSSNILDEFCLLFAVIVFQSYVTKWSVVNISNSGICKELLLQPTATLFAYLLRELCALPSVALMRLY